MKKVIVVLIILLLTGAVCVLGYLQYQSGITLDAAADKITQLKSQIEKLQSDDNPNGEPAVAVQSGKYTIDQVALDAGGVSNEDTGFRILADGTFTAFMGWGFGHQGTYEIQGEQLVCTSNLFYWEGGSTGERATNVTFTFDASTYGTLRLTGIIIDDEDTDKLILPEAIALGNTYSIR